MTNKSKTEMTLLDILCEVGAQQQAAERKLDTKRRNITRLTKTGEKKQNGVVRPPRVAQTHLGEEAQVRSEAEQSETLGTERDQLRKDGQERANSPSGLSTESPNYVIDAAMVYHESGEEQVHQVESAKNPPKRVSNKTYHLIRKKLIASYRRVIWREKRMLQKFKEAGAPSQAIDVTRLVQIPNYKWRHVAWRIARAGRQRNAPYRRRERVPTAAEAKQLAWAVAYGRVPFPLHHRDVILMSEPSFLSKHRAWRARRPKQQQPEEVQPSSKKRDLH